MCEGVECCWGLYVGCFVVGEVDDDLEVVVVFGEYECVCVEFLFVEDCVYVVECYWFDLGCDGEVFGEDEVWLVGYYD